MPGPLGPESFNRLRRVSRKFGYYPNLDDVRNLIATVERARARIAELEAELAEERKR